MAAEDETDYGTVLTAFLEDSEDEIDLFLQSDRYYIEGLALQEIIMASFISSEAADNDEEIMSSFITSSSSEAADNDEEEEEKKSEDGEEMFCEICTERKEHDQMFEIRDCNHSFCNQCINNHVESKLDENVSKVHCPAVDCGVELNIDSCKTIVSDNVLAKWDKALCESSILDSQKFYCPFKDCSAMMVNDSTDDEVIRESECMNCWRLFCAACRVPWHSGVGCEEFQATNEGEREREDFMLRELVKQKEWNRCPSCKYYVEKKSGCIHITCRCGFQFCYACGDTWSNTHACVRRA